MNIQVLPLNLGLAAAPFDRLGAVQSEYSLRGRRTATAAVPPAEREVSRGIAADVRSRWAGVPCVAIANVRASRSTAPNGSFGNRERPLSADRIRQPIRTLAPAALPAKAVCQVVSRRTYVRADRLTGNDHRRELVWPNELTAPVVIDRRSPAWPPPLSRRRPALLARR